MINNLDIYKVFYYVAKTGSLTKAANELAITQPAVSQSMRQLEKQLNVKLFSRTAKGVKLTREGELLFPYVDRGYSSICQGELKIKSLLSLDTGEIRIGASDMGLKYFLLPYLEEFHTKYPKVKITLRDISTPLTIDALNRGEIDFGIISSPFRASYENLKLIDVREILDVFVAGSNLFHLKDQKLPYQILSHLPFICLPGNTSTRQYLDDFVKKNGIYISPGYETSTSDMIIELAKKNLGIGCVVEDFAKEALDDGTLIRLNFYPQIPKRHLSVVMRNDEQLPPAADSLIKLLL